MNDELPITMEDDPLYEVYDIADAFLIAFVVLLTLAVILLPVVL